jgi:7-cyano-7-deazaguanine tRNA-ribosyltransferase
MRLYIAWYPSDPLYSIYDADAALLISPTSLAKRWKVQDLSYQPNYLMVDSGAFRYSITGERHTQRHIFERQLRMIEGATCDVTICQLDFPLIKPNLTSNERDDLIHKTLGNAYELMNRVHQTQVISPKCLMGIVQGYDIDSMLYSAHELKQLGYQKFGIGSLALLYNNDKILERVRAVQEVVGRDLHIFGVTGAAISPHFRHLGIFSVDSSRPAKAAMYNVVFSSNPFKRHRIRPSRGNYWQKTYIEEPFVCHCPVCKGEPNEDILKMGKREYIFKRTLHNYYHLKLTITASDVKLRAYTV